MKVDIFKIGNRWRCNLQALPTFTPQGNSSWYPLKRCLGGSQHDSGHGGKEKNPYASTGN
jgi:hypothetical protein